MPIQPIRSKFSFEVLTDSDLRAIQQATLEVLAGVGVRFPSEKALLIFAEHGVEVDFKSKIVRLAPDFVDEKMQDAPREYLLAGRTEENHLSVGDGQSYFGTDGSGTQTIDIASGIQRETNKQDVAMMARVADYLSSISFYWPMVSAQDHGKLAPLHEIDAAFHNTTKHVQTPTVVGARLARYAVRMAEVLAGNTDALRRHPPLSSLICTISPLAQDREGIEAAMVFAEAGIPVGFMGMPTMGSTAPALPGGALVVANAETVSAMVLMQLVAPGAPVFQSILASGLHPQSADYLVSIPEKYLCNAAAVQLSHDWGVPSLAGSFGVDSDWKNGWQLGRDSVYTALMIAMAGTDLSIGLGMLSASTLLYPEQILFDDEIYHTHRILSQGLEASREKLAVDVITRVGTGGHFLAEKHTKKNLRNRWLPKLTHPIFIEQANGQKDIRERASEDFRKILSGHTPIPLETSQAREINVILKTAAREIENC